MLCLLVACSEPEPVCDICTTSAVIYGRVLRANEDVVAGAAMVVEAHRERCDSADVPGISDGNLVTAADGSYRADIVAGTGPFIACPRVTVALPYGSPDHVTVEARPTSRPRTVTVDANRFAA